MLIPTSERSPWWDLAIVLAPAVIAASAILIPWWVDRHSEDEGENDDTGNQRGSQDA